MLRSFCLFLLKYFPVKPFFLLFILILTLFSCATYEPSAPSRPRTAQEIERGEFKALMEKDSISKKETAAESLEVLLNGDPNDKRVSLIINNASNCDIIVRFAGAKSYNLPVRKNFRNFIVIEKGTYSMGANLCNSRFSKTKTFDDSLTVTLSEAGN